MAEQDLEMFIFGDDPSSPLPFLSSSPPLATSNPSFSIQGSSLSPSLPSQSFSFPSQSSFSPVTVQPLSPIITVQPPDAPAYLSFPPTTTPPPSLSPDALNPLPIVPSPYHSPLSTISSVPSPNHLSPDSTPSQPTSTPSPPSYQVSPHVSPPVSPPQSQSIKKRKIAEENSGSCAQEEWRDYSLGPRPFPVIDYITLQSINEHLDVAIQQMGAKFSFSQTDNAFICYRQNYLKIICLFRSPQPIETMCVNDNGVPRKVTSISAKLYALDEINGALIDEMRVGLHHLGKKRRKESKIDIEMASFQKGKVEFSNLQFEKSNFVKSEQTEYYRMVLAVYANCGDLSFPILSKISARIIVRGQNPGFYETTKPQTNSQSTPSCTDTNFVANISVNNNENNYVNNQPSPDDNQFNNFNSPTNFNNALITTSENNVQLETTITEQVIINVPNNIPEHVQVHIKQEVDATWEKVGGDSVVHYGKVGINTTDPKEALHVQGNVLVTGTVYKPSDKRIKSEIVPVDPKAQLSNIRKLQLYDYTVKSSQEKERGVLAQELAEVLPNAVHEVGDVEVKGDKIPSLLVVNERVLLYENIGATQQLDKELETEKGTIEVIGSEISKVAQKASEDNVQVNGTIQSMLDLLFKEEVKRRGCPTKISYAGLEEEYVTCSFSFLRMGPARTLLLVGHFCPPLWALASVFMFSNVKERRQLGLSSFIKYVSWLSLYSLYSLGILSIQPLLYFLTIGAGIVACIITYAYLNLRKILKEEQKDKRQPLFKALGLNPPEQKLNFYLF